MTAFDQRGIGKLRVLIGLLVIAALVTGYFWAAMKWSYASGERAGWVQKLSRKGWVCKTWEGEMAMVSMPGAATEKFAFTVWNGSAVEQINKLMGGVAVPADFARILERYLRPRSDSDLQIINPALKKTINSSGTGLKDVETAVVGGIRLYVRF